MGMAGLSGRASDVCEGKCLDQSKPARPRKEPVPYHSPEVGQTPPFLDAGDASLSLGAVVRCDSIGFLGRRRCLVLLFP
jgi:hypothetical protein